QWNVVGLFRQHLNPWNFAYMQKAIAASGAAIGRLTGGPGAGYQTLNTTITAAAAQGDVPLSEPLGTLALLPFEKKVRLLQPMTPAEVSGEVYGRADKWD